MCLSLAISVAVVLLGPLRADEPAAADDAPHRRSVELVQRALASRPRSAELIEVLGSVHYRWGHFSESVPAFRRALELDASLAGPRMALASIHARQGDGDAAAEIYRQLVTSRNPGLVVSGRRGLADVAYGRGDYAQAAVELRDATRRNPGSAELWYHLGRALDAEARRQRKAGSSPTAADSQAGDASSESASERERGAIQALERALALDPTHAQAHYTLGMLLLRQGERKRSRAALELFRKHRKATHGVDAEKVARSPQVFEADTALELARVLHELGDVAAALDHVSVALVTHPRYEKALSLRASIQSRQGQTAAAKRSYIELLDVNPNHTEALWRLSQLALAEKDVAKGGALLLRAVESRPGFVAGWELLATLASERSLYSERATEFADRALRLRASAKNFERLAMSHFAERRLDEAERVLRDGLRRFPESRDLELGFRAVMQARDGR